MKIKNWIACVQDRGKWKEVVEKAKTLNQEVQHLEEEEELVFLANVCSAGVCSQPCENGVCIEHFTDCFSSG